MDTEDHMIRTLLAEPPPTVHAASAARRRLTDEIAAEAAARGVGGAARRGPRRAAWGGSGRHAAWRRWSLGGAGLTAVAAAALVVALTAGQAGTGGRPAPDTGGGPGAAPAGPAADASPAELLLAAAGTAERMSGTGKYWRFLSVSETGPLRVPAGPEPYRIMQREASETWTARDPGGQSWNGEQTLGFRPRTDADRLAWERAGSPKKVDLGPADSPDGGRVTRSIDPQPGTLSRSESYPTYDSEFGPLALAELPTDPQALRAAVIARVTERKGGGGEAPPQAALNMSTFQLLSWLLAKAPATAALRSAAFTVLSGLPGVVNAGPARDAADRPGVALDLREANGKGDGKYATRARLILDPTTYRLLGVAIASGPVGPDGDVDMSPGTVFKESATVILRAEWTDEEPVAPDLR